VIALDTNVLVYAKRSETPHHERARTLLQDLAQGQEPWALPWPCVYEFLRVVTHPRVFATPTDIENALEDLETLFDSPSLILLGEGPAHRGHLRHAVLAGRASGNLAHDAHIAALVLEHGVDELWTSDRHFTRFPGLRVRDPFHDFVHEPRARYRAPRQASARTRRTR
jgi:toxin-antitoxin system PIN domain toxin